MQMNAWRMRLAAIAAGIAVLGLYLLAGGSFAPGSKGVVQIEFGMYPEEFTGLEVVIDGEVAGTLRRFGNASRTGFELAEGEHTVALRHPGFPCEPVRVAAQVMRPNLLVADIQERWRDGKSRTEIVLTR